jgi:glutaredoxin 3
LKKKGLSFEDVRVDLQPEFRAEMETLSGSRTVPQIFIAGNTIGGYDDIARLDASGELDTMLGR